jgi:hypothetical protein
MSAALLAAALEVVELAWSKTDSPALEGLAFNLLPALRAAVAAAGATTVQPALVVPPLNYTLREILGRPNFMCGGIAASLRQLGHNIECKAEAEQAAVIHWMLTSYALHGDAWRDRCKEDLARAATLAAGASA